MTQSVEILIVDDEPAVRSFLQDMLARKGRRITTAASGEEALEHIAAQEFDLVLLDLKMKAVGGMEVLAKLKKQWPDTAVIVLTAHATLDTAVEAVRRGAHDYLFKPCTIGELRESMHAALRDRRQTMRQREMLDQLERSLSDNLKDLHTLGAKPSLESERDGRAEDRFLHWGELVIDLIRHVVTLDGHPLEISTTQFDMLAYLVREAPRVVSPQELVREVQDWESEPKPEEARNIVRSHIYHIRESIETVSGRRDIIRTVRGVGYTMNEAEL